MVPHVPTHKEKLHKETSQPSPGRSTRSKKGEITHLGLKPAREGAGKIPIGQQSTPEERVNGTTVYCPRGHWSS